MSNYFEEMRPYAQRASAALGIPISVILAQWAHESDYGKSYGVSHRNNHAGISNFIGKPYSWSKALRVEPRPKSEGSWYNVYKNTNDFVDDYIHVMNLDYYDEVRVAGATPGIDDDVLELGESPFAGNHYMLNGVPGGSIMKMIKSNGLTRYDDLKIVETPIEIDKMKNIINKEPGNYAVSKDLKFAVLTGAAALTLIKILES